MTTAERCFVLSFGCFCVSSGRRGDKGVVLGESACEREKWSDRERDVSQEKEKERKDLWRRRSKGRERGYKRTRKRLRGREAERERREESF
eukprot:1394904-Amorphochlora_amoeboformis.AAC.2